LALCPLLHSLAWRCDGSVRSGATSHELRIRVARSRDTILGWIESGLRMGGGSAAPDGLERLSEYRRLFND
jgi:hypothetical protein